jgi:pyruvate dehydrogenase E2 component (dihydrolipoamide acetyltransferase)
VFYFLVVHIGGSKPFASIMLSKTVLPLSRRGGSLVSLIRRPHPSWSSSLLRRSFHATPAFLNDLPYHLVVGLPALSPTMESGALAEWYVAEGDAISAGDAVAKIETDKASIDFEAQDDVYVAKLLLPAGDGADLPVGTPIMITVEDEGDVAAFKDYVHSADSAPTPAAATPSTEPPKEAAPAPPPAAASDPPPTPVAVAEPAPAVAPTPAVAAVPPTSTSSSGDGQSVTIAWARPAASAAPLSKLMDKQQTEYMKLYGTTGQRAVAAEE